MEGFFVIIIVRVEPVTDARGIATRGGRRGLWTGRLDGEEGRREADGLA